MVRFDGDAVLRRLRRAGAALGERTRAAASALERRRWARTLAFVALWACATGIALAFGTGSGSNGHRALASARATPRAAQTRARRRTSAPVVSAREAARDNAAIGRVRRYTASVSVGSRRQREVALTFDDGPGVFTRRILRILRRYRVPATFFQIGRVAALNQGLGRAELRGGFAIGDHTQSHPYMGALSASAQRAEVVDAARAIRAYGAPYPHLFRPPYLSYNRATLQTLRRQRMLMILWSVDTKDFSQPGVKQIVHAALTGARPGAIILMHDGGGPRGQTVAALPRIIRQLRWRHYRLVTVPRLLLDDPPPRPPRRAHRAARRHHRHARRALRRQDRHTQQAAGRGHRHAHRAARRQHRHARHAARHRRRHARRAARRHDRQARRARRAAGGLRSPPAPRTGY